MKSVVWTNSRFLELVERKASAPRSERPFLVFVVPNSTMRSPLLSVINHKRNFDIAVRFYEEPACNSDLLRGAEYVATGGLSKFHAAGQFFEQLQLEREYEGYLFLDGDLEFDANQLSPFLSFVHSCGLDLAQPSVSRDSYCYWKMAYHQPGFVFRETSFVEVMAPYFSRAALTVALPTFLKSISTYGLDLVWPSLIGNRGIGVVDAFQIRHRDQVNHTEGAFYKYLKSIGVDLDEEERLILLEYGVEAHTAHSKRGYFWKRNWLFSKEAPELVSVLLNAPEIHTDKQFLIDLAMCYSRWRTARSEQELTAAIGHFLCGNYLTSNLENDFFERSQSIPG